MDSMNHDDLYDVSVMDECFSFLFFFRSLKTVDTTRKEKPANKRTRAVSTRSLFEFFGEPTRTKCKPRKSLHVHRDILFVRSKQLSVRSTRHCDPSIHERTNCDSSNRFYRSSSVLRVANVSDQATSKRRQKKDNL